MEVMEEGNLMDRVRILLQRDSTYYQEHQSVFQENICIGVIGGILDFPHYASFAAAKMVMWWEEEYLAAFNKPSGLQGEILQEVNGERGCGGVAKTSVPVTMVNRIKECGMQLLEHLHTLSQEALDHADLQVLTGTLGAAALIKNCLWVYNQQINKLDITPGARLPLITTYRQFQEMSESLAERLLDLHCRLISLYVLQDADCLHWEYQQPFFESERGSFVVQMWWHYMQGTRSDLWSTVPPKTAQRVLAGMLNEALTILSVRYTQARVSSERANLLVTDISNILICVRQLLPSICTTAAELTGVSILSQVVRDIHTKCHSLLQCILLRGCPLNLLHKESNPQVVVHSYGSRKNRKITYAKKDKEAVNLRVVFFNDCEEICCFTEMTSTEIAPWVVFSSTEKRYLEPIFPANLEDIYFELRVLLSQPQPSWHLLLKVLLMNNCWVSNKILLYITGKFEKERATSKEHRCGGFLCSGCCYLPDTQVEEALVYIIINTGSVSDMKNTLLQKLESNPKWAECLDKNQVWNIQWPPWLRALIKPICYILTPLVDIIIHSTKMNDSTDDSLSLIIEILSEVVDCLPCGVVSCCALLTVNLPADTSPLAHSVLAQLLVAALYTLIIDTPLAEQLCNLEDHQLSNILTAVSDLGIIENPIIDTEGFSYVSEAEVSELLLTVFGWQSLKVLYEYIKLESNWLATTLGQKPTASYSQTLLYTMFHVGSQPFDQVLTGEWRPDWRALLQSPLGLSADSAWQQISQRPEFWDDSNDSVHDKSVVKHLKCIFNRLSSNN